MICDFCRLMEGIAIYIYISFLDLKVIEFVLYISTYASKKMENLSFIRKGWGSKKDCYFLF
jgi:hypothetical protein